MAYSSAKDSPSLRSTLDSIATLPDSSRPRTTGKSYQSQKESSVRRSSTDKQTTSKVTEYSGKSRSQGAQTASGRNAAHGKTSTHPASPQNHRMAFGPRPTTPAQPTKPHASPAQVRRTSSAVHEAQSELPDSPEIETKSIVPDKPRTAESEKNDPAIPQATPVTGHFNIICLTAKGYNRLIDLLLREANYYDQMGDMGKDAVNVMENMVYTFSKSSSRFTGLDGSAEVLLTIMDEDFTNILGILLKSAYSNREDPTVDYSQSLPYAGT